MAKKKSIEQRREAGLNFLRDKLSPEVFAKADEMLAQMSDEEFEELPAIFQRMEDELADLTADAKTGHMNYQMAKADEEAEGA